MLCLGGKQFCTSSWLGKLLKSMRSSMLQGTESQNMKTMDQNPKNLLQNKNLNKNPTGCLWPGGPLMESWNALGWMGL